MWECTTVVQAVGQKKQRRVFQRLVSWCFEAKSRDCQLSRVDLTTAVGGPAHLLRRHLQELRRRVERDLGYKGIETFVVETSEGNGVLHMVWAWAGSRESSSSIKDGFRKSGPKFTGLRLSSFVG